MFRKTRALVQCTYYYIGPWYTWTRHTPYTVLYICCTCPAIICWISCLLMISNEHGMRHASGWCKQLYIRNILSRIQDLPKFAKLLLHFNVVRCFCVEIFSFCQTIYQEKSRTKVFGPLWILKYYICPFLFFYFWQRSF